ncbi:hypothetical protein [Priestia aryabhattai]|uniref:hypothetical protein n=1 Tax=Priestia aryabhattai TaxID=412384 RepID=UPI000532DEB0|nr:hypothetical protein [Priestia aryabhattai]
MKKVYSMLIAYALVLSVTACSSNSEEVSKEENSLNGFGERKNENASAVKTKENKQQSSEQAIEDLHKFFAYIDEENVPKVAELLRHTEGENIVPSNKDVEEFIKEWKTYNFKETADIQIIGVNDLVKSEREETKGYKHQVFWMICSYKGDVSNEFSKMLVVAEYNEKFYMVDDVPIDNGIDAIQKKYWEKYGLVDSDQVKLEELPDTSTEDVEPKEMPDASNGAVKPKELDPNTGNHNDKKSESTEKSEAAPDESTPPVEQMAPQKEYDYDNSSGYIIAELLLKDVLNKTFSTYPDLIGSYVEEVHRDGDYGFKVKTNTKTIYVLFKSKDGKKWAITDITNGNKLIENGVKVNGEKVVLFNKTQFDYSNSENYTISDKVFAEALDEMFAEFSYVVGTKMISFQRKSEDEIVVQTDMRNIRVEILESGDWAVSDHNSAKPILEDAGSLP